jgi:aldehyde:ferredoxin oxidoreductase
MLDAGVDPLSPDNVLLLLTGPLTGTLAPGSNRFCVVTKSPHTGTFLDSHCGGSFGPAVKYAGYDGLVIRKRAREPSVVVVDEEGFRLLEAGDFWGGNAMDSQDQLDSTLGPGYEKVVIGPAGERLSTISSVFSGKRAAGRGGCGAVMGSKNLKAVCVKGRGHGISIQDPEGMRKACWTAHRMLRMSETTVRSLPAEGTCNILETVNEVGALPSGNFRSGSFDGAGELSGARWREEMWIRDAACFGCSIGCSKASRVGKGRFKGDETEGPDYETVWAFGPQCMNSDKGLIIHLEKLCDEYGMDTISAGNILGFVMELYERGMIGPGDLGGVVPKWGSAEAMSRLVEDMGEMNGVGEYLSRGVRRLSEDHPGSQGFAMHVKGLELPAYSPRAAKGMALAYATSDRGGCHLRGYPAMMELLGMRGGADPLETQGKPQLVVDSQDEIAVVDSCDICLFGTFGFGLREILRMVNAATGFGYGSAAELKTLGERVYTMTRLFNVREGMGRKDDTLPARCLQEPMPDGPARGQVVELDRMLDVYYGIRGWSDEGVPTPDTVERLQLSFIS